MTVSRRQILQVLVGAATPHLLPLPLAQGCDDPPKHYPDPCSGAFVQHSAYLAVADVRGFFKQQGVTLTFQRLTTSDWRELAKIVADAGVAHIFGISAIRSLLADSPLIVVAAPRNQVDFALWSRVVIKSPEDLGGKKIGLGLTGSGSLMAWETISTEPAFLPVKLKVTTVPSFRDAERFPAVERGALDGGLFPVSFDNKLKAAGLHKIRQTGALPFAEHVLVTTDRILKDPRNRRFLVGYVKAIVSASQFLDSNPTESVDILAKYWTLPRDTAEDLYSRYRGSSQIPLPTAVGLQNVVRELQIAFPADKGKLSGIKVDRIFTEDIVRAVQSSSLPLRSPLPKG